MTVCLFSSFRSKTCLVHLSFFFVSSSVDTLGLTEGSGGSLPPPPHPPDYQTTIGGTLKSGRKTRVSRTQLREGGEADCGGDGHSSI